LQNRDFRVVDIKGLNIERYFYFIQLQGQPEALPELFIRFAEKKRPPRNFLDGQTW
jgi:LysR family transcriptional regulator, transcriptional activator of the cysJI operon